jgi:aspartate racemase
VQKLERGAPVFVGRPIANTQAYVLDEELELVPPGVTGEVFLGGHGVALGYLGRPELTAARFLPDPFSSNPRARLYKTGDLGRQRPDGTLDLLGRADFQVKLRGHRIELGEIEAALATHPAVREAAVGTCEPSPGDARLVAWVAARSTRADLPAELRAHLYATLPEIMVPSRVIVLEALPRTANGKIDRKALLAAPEPAAVGIAPLPKARRGAIELRLLGIWEEVLGAKGIGTQQTFFEAGGHSLLALRLFDRIERAFGVKLPVASLFQAPTIEAQAEILRREGFAPSWSSLVPIQPKGSRPPFFCVHAIGGNVLNYRLLAKALGDDQPFFGLQARGLGGQEEPHGSVEEMAAGYLHELLEEQPHGPFLIGGSSSGGVVAFEMAQQLHARGERVGLLVLMDTFLPDATPRHRARCVDYHIGTLLAATPREGLAYLARRVRARFGGVAGPTDAALRAAPLEVRHVIEANMRSVARYIPRPYAGSAVMLLSRDEPDRVREDGRLAWARLVEGGLVVRPVPGSHDTMLEEPHAAEVARVLERCLVSQAWGPQT